MYKFLVKSAGSGYTANCISLNADLNSYAVVDNEKHYEPGTVFNFDYTGTVQEVELLPGKYKLQCWGAQGGDSTPNSGVGSKGGYSEGVLTIASPTTVYVFVGGKGVYGTNSTSVSNGGWNGGGGSVSESSNDANNEYGISYPACGGGATDIATVTSDMSYYNYRTNRSMASLLSRCIVAGGGAGASSFDMRYETDYGTLYDSGRSDQNSVGGGTIGRGLGGGTQTGGGGSFGFGENQTITYYRYVSGAGGGGWYGGGSSYDDIYWTLASKSGGGSGFVNIADNASSRPSGYTGLQLDSGTTRAGYLSFKSPTGEYETGHSGNGYARITVLDPNYTPPKATITWTTQTGTWNESTYSSAADNKKFTCKSPGASSSTVLRCTFSGISYIKFRCCYQGESDYDYLTVGALDTTCTRSSYGTSLKGTTGTWKEITYTCDSGEHYVEFCYSKDDSVDTPPDNAEVYIFDLIEA